jgi:hypothetical protein
MSTHEIVGIDVAARQLVAVVEEIMLAAAYENTVAGRGALGESTVLQLAGRCGSCSPPPGCAGAAGRQAECVEQDRLAGPSLAGQDAHRAKGKIEPVDKNEPEQLCAEDIMAAVSNTVVNG